MKKVKKTINYTAFSTLPVRMQDVHTLNRLEPSSNLTFIRCKFGNHLRFDALCE